MRNALLREGIETPTDTTSYGHNAELSWLLDQALSVLGVESTYCTDIIQKLLDHSLQFGYDYEYGGVFRDGIGEEKALVSDKEWWQNFEAMVGYANGHLRFGDSSYLQCLPSKHMEYYRYPL